MEASPGAALGGIVTQLVIGLSLVHPDSLSSLGGEAVCR